MLRGASRMFRRIHFVVADDVIFSLTLPALNPAEATSFVALKGRFFSKQRPQLKAETRVLLLGQKWPSAASRGDTQRP